MKEKLKGIGWGVIGIACFVGLIILILFLIKGGIWLSATIYPYLATVMNWTISITVLIFLPLSISKKLRGFTGLSIYITSYIFGATLWVWGLLLTYFLWGGLALFIGLFMMGVGVVPIAMLASIFKGMWSTLGQLALLLVMTFATRAFGVYLIAKHEEQLDQTVGTFIAERGENSRKGKGQNFLSFIDKMPHWLKWLLVLPAAFIGDMAAQSIGLIIATITCLRGPYANAFIWYTFAPIIWLVVGLRFAPSHRSLAGAILAAIKIVVLLYNSYSAIDFLNHGGSWTDIYPITEAPLWWHLITYIVGIIALIVFYGLIYNSDRRARLKYS
jgi:hypothetical protein